MNVTSFISVDVNNINDEYNVGDKLSGSALLIIEEGDFLLKEDRLKLTVLDDTMVIVSKEVTLEQFMLKVTNPSALVDVDGSLGYQREGDGMIPFLLETVFSLEIREGGLNFNLTLEYIDSDDTTLMVSKLINVSASSDLPLIEDVVFSVMDKDSNFLESKQFYNSQMIGCFARYFNQDDVNISIFGPSSTLDEPYIMFNDPICIDDSEYAGYCGGVVNVTVTSRGEWTCYVSVVSELGSDSGVGDVLVMNNSLPRWISNLTEISLDITGKVLDNISLDLDNYFYDSDGDTLEFVSKRNTMISVQIDNGVVKFINAANYEGGDVVEFIASDNYGETSSGYITLNVGLTAKKCVSDGDCESNEICNYNVCMQVTNQTIVECVENWDCLKWGECVNGVQSRSCNDLNGCGTTATKPALIAECTSVKQNVLAEEEESTVVKEVPIEQKSNVIYVIVIVLGSALVFGGLGVFLWKRYNKKIDVEKKEEKSVGSEEKVVEQQKDLSAIEIYVKDMLDKGFNVEDAKKNLIDSGWDAKDVQKVCDLTVLKKFLADSRAKGFKDDVIRKSLEGKDWSKELLDELFK